MSSNFGGYFTFLVFVLTVLTTVIELLQVSMKQNFFIIIILCVFTPVEESHYSSFGVCFGDRTRLKCIRKPECT